MRGHGCHVITDSGHDRAPPPAGQGILRTAAYPLVVVSLAESPEYGPRAKFNANAGCHAKGDSGSLDLTPMTKPPLCAARGFTRCTRTDHLHLPRPRTGPDDHQPALRTCVLSPREGHDLPMPVTDSFRVPAR
jgi:hypothetical protein